MKGLNFWMAGFVWNSLALAQTEISVRVCNEAHVAARTLKQAEKEATFVLHTGGVAATWMDCNAEAMARPLGPHDFVLNVRGYLPSQSGGSKQKYVLGDTWVIDGTKQTSVNVYYDAVREFASRRLEQATIDQILGYAIAHEFGHVFLGAAHTLSGVMKTEWYKHELGLISKGDLRFTLGQRERIQDELASRIRMSQAVAD